MNLFDCYRKKAALLLLFLSCHLILIENISGKSIGEIFISPSDSLISVDDSTQKKSYSKSFFDFHEIQVSTFLRISPSGQINQDGFSSELFLNGLNFSGKCNLFNLPMILSVTPVFLNGRYNSVLSEYSFGFDYQQYLTNLKKKALSKVDSLKKSVIVNAAPDYFSYKDSLSSLEKIKNKNLKELSPAFIQQFYHKRDSLKKVLASKGELFKIDEVKELAGIDSIISNNEKFKTHYKDLLEIQKKYLSINSLLSDTLAKLDNIKSQIMQASSIKELLENKFNGALANNKLQSSKITSLEELNLGSFSLNESPISCGRISGSGVNIQIHPTQFFYKVTTGLTKDPFRQLTFGSQNLNPVSNQQFLGYLKTGFETDNNLQEGSLLFLRDININGIDLPFKRNNIVFSVKSENKLNDHLTSVFQVSKSNLYFKQINNSENNNQSKQNNFLEKSAFITSLQNDFSRLHSSLKGGVEYTGNNFIILNQTFSDRGLVKIFLEQNSSFLKNKLFINQYISKDFTPEWSKTMNNTSSSLYRNNISVALFKNIRITTGYSFLKKTSYVSQATGQNIIGINQNSKIVGIQYTIRKDSLVQIMGLNYIDQQFNFNQSELTIHSSQKQIQLSDCILFRKHQFDILAISNNLVSTDSIRKYWSGSFQYGYQIKKINGLIKSGANCTLDKSSLLQYGFTFSFITEIKNKFIISFNQQLNHWNYSILNNKYTYESQLSILYKFD